MMNALNYCLLLLFSFTSVSAQHIVEGNVINERTGEAIPFATVILSGTRNATSTDSTGVFRLRLLKYSPNDTLLFSAVGYMTLKVAIKKGTSLDIILQEDTKTLSEINVSDKRRELEIGSYNIADNMEYLNTGGQLAKKFEMPATHQYLKEIRIRRHPTYNDHSPQTRFRIQIYSENPKTKGPGEKICLDTIEVNDKNNGEIRVDVAKYNITITNSPFFVGIETLPIPINERYQLIRMGHIVNGNPENPAYYEIIYQPFLSVGRSKNNNGWVSSNSPNSKWLKHRIVPAIKVIVN